MYTNKQNRRHFLGTAAMTLAVAQLWLLGDVIPPSGLDRHAIISGGIGHNLPQKAPEAFAQAVIDVDSY